jgi:hypothetical protein
MPRAARVAWFRRRRRGGGRSFVREAFGIPCASTSRHRAQRIAVAERAPWR